VTSPSCAPLHPTVRSALPRRRQAAGSLPADILSSWPRPSPADAMSVKIAPSIRAKLHCITVKEISQPSKELRWYATMAEMITLSAVLRLAAGRFWDPDSDSECEDLGDAEELLPPESISPEQLRPVTAVTARPTTGQRPARSSPSPPLCRTKPPWRSVWKGPFPPARSSLAATLGDFLPPEIRTAAEPGDASGSAGKLPDPVLPGERVGGPDLAQEGTLPPVCDPIGQGPVTLSPVPAQSRLSLFPSCLPPPQDHLPPSGRRRRLVNATVPQHLLSPTPYRDALMAGRGRFHRRGQEGRGASAA
jgi:hypothetical protein